MSSIERALSQLVSGSAQGLCPGLSATASASSASATVAYDGSSLRMQLARRGPVRPLSAYGDSLCGTFTFPTRSSRPATAEWRLEHAGVLLEAMRHLLNGEPTSTAVDMPWASSAMM
jgi:hypothetical protein